LGHFLVSDRLTYSIIQAVGALIGTFDAAGGSFSGDGRQQLSTEEREAKRREFFKKRPLADQVLQAEAVQSE
jgi:hypothetical protein